MEQINVLGLLMVGFIGKIYPTEMIVRCFEYFVVSRALYRRICKDFQIPLRSNPDSLDIEIHCVTLNTIKRCLEKFLSSKENASYLLMRFM